MSFLGSGPLGMIHKRTVCPLRLSSPDAPVLALEFDEPESSSSPQAPTPTASTRAIRAQAIHVILLRTVLFLSSLRKRFW